MRLLNLPETDVAAHTAITDVMAPAYTGGGTMPHDNPLQFAIVWRHMVRGAGRFSAPLADELRTTLRAEWGTSDSSAAGGWRTVAALETLTRAVTRAALRTLAGPEFARSEALLFHAPRYSAAMFTCAAVIAALPPWMRPLLGHIVGLPARWHFRACMRALTPLVAERIGEMLDAQQEERSGVGHDGGGGSVLTRLVEMCAEEGPREMEPRRVAHRLLVLIAQSAFPIGFFAANAVLDLHSSPDAETFVSALRQEADGVVRALEQEGGLNTGRVDQELHRVDSAVKESMRLSPFSAVVCERTVARDGGLDLGDGLVVPKGVRIGVALRAAHLSEEYYEKAGRYDALRFSRPHKEGRKEERREKTTTVSEKFVLFGYGQHACPGRFYAVLMLKILLAIVVSEYDVKVIGKKAPEKVDVLNAIMPPFNAKLRVRKRVDYDIS